MTPNLYRVVVSAVAALTLGLTSFAANAAGPGPTAIGDYVTVVYICDANHIAILTKNSGWLYINPTDVGATPANWMLSAALSLLTTGKQIERAYMPTGTAVADGCGHNAIEITTFSATATP